MAELTVQAISPDGIDPLANLAAADVAGDSVRKSNGLIIVVSNGDAGSHDVTFAAPVAEAGCGSYGQLPVSDIVVSVPAGEARYITVPSGYAVDGFLQWTYDGVTSVEVGVFVASPNA